MRPPRFWFALFLFPLLFACGKESQERVSANFGTGELRWSSFPVQIQIDAALLFNSRSARDIHDAISFWESRANKRLFALTGLWNNSSPPYTGPTGNPGALLGNVIYMQNPWPYDPKIAGKTIIHSNQSVIESSVILINGMTHLCSGLCHGYDGSVSRRKLIAHELGHFLGLDHASSSKDIMYPEILPGGALEELTVNGPLLQQLTR